MAINEADDMLEQTVSTTGPAPADHGNEYVAMLREDAVTQETALKQSMFVASKVDPDRRAKAQRLADEFKIPVDVADRQFEALTEAKVRTENDYAEMIRKNPSLSKWLEDPNNAAVARDDIDALSGIEQKVQDYGKLSKLYLAMNSGAATAISNVLKIPALAYDAAAYLPNRANVALGRPEEQVKAPEWMTNNPVTRYFDTAAQDSHVPEMDMDVATELKNMNFGRAGMGLAVSFAANFPQQAAIIASAFSGAPLLGSFGAGVTTASGTADRDRKAGVDPEIALSNAINHGSIEMLGEMLGTAGIFNRIEKQVVAQHGKTVWKEVAKEFSKTLAKAAGIEGIEEGVTSVGQDASDVLTGARAESAEGIPGRAVNAFLTGAASGGMLTAPAAIASGKAKSREMRQAELATQFLTDINEAAQATKLKARSPELQTNLIDQIVQGTGIDKMAIGVQAVESYFQSKKINTASVMQEIGALKEYEAAKEAGTEIELPLSQWIDKVGPTEHFQALAQHVRLGEQGVTLAEAQSQKEEADAQTKQDLQKASEAAVDPAQDQGLAEPKVHDLVLEQLKGAGFDGPTAQSYAQIYDSAFEAMGKRAGVSPAELFNRYGLQIQRAEKAPVGGEQVLEQGAQLDMSQEARMQRAQAMGFDTSKTWFHGTNRDIEGFEGHRAGRSGRKHGEVFWFTTNPEIADNFAEHAAETDYLRGAQKIDRAADEKLEKKVRALRNKWMMTTDKAKRLALEEEIDAIEAVRISDRYRGQNIVPAHLKATNPLVHDAGGRFLKEAEVNAVIDQAKAAGHDSVHFLNMIDSPRGGTDAPSDVMAVFSPAQIRSINAAFDPSKAESIQILHQSPVEQGPGSPQTTYPKPDQVEVVEAAREVADGKPNHKDARKAAIDRFRGKSFINAHTGWGVTIPPKGIKKTLGSSTSDVDVVALEHLDELLEAAIYERVGPDLEGDPNIKAVHYFYAPLQVGDELRAIRIMVRETNEGQRFYHHMVSETTKPAGHLLRAPSENGEATGRGELRGEDTAGTSDAPSLSEGSLSANSGPRSITLSDFESLINAERGKFPLFQSDDAGDEARGQIRIGHKDGKRTFEIDVLRKADLSTFIHETGHFFLEIMGDLAEAENAPQAIKDDYQTLLDWFGVKDRKGVTTEQHEQFARGFEAYTMEGKAPTDKLRMAFARFRVWLTSIYRQLRSLNVELTDEVRAVFDRMLATEEELEAAQAELAAKPLFVDPKAMGMSDKQAYAYMNAIFEAEQDSREVVNQKLMAHYRRAQSAAYKEEAAVVRERIEKEVSARPIYRAIEALRNEKQFDGSPFKLSREGLAEYGADVPKALPRGTVAKKGQGIHPDVAAELLGFTSGQELVSQLATVPTMQSEIEKLTQREMAERFPDLFTNGKLPEEALKAAHNRKRSQLLRMELEHLASNNMPVMKDAIRRVARRMPTEKAVREQAQAIVGSRLVKELKPYLYMRAEVRAAKEAGKALAKGDINAAFEAKRLELLNHELYLAAVEAQDQVEASLEMFKKLKQSDEKIGKSRDLDLVNTARAILAEVGIGRSDKKAAEYLEQIKRYDPDTYATVQALIESVAGLDMHYTQLPFDDFVALQDTVRGLWDLAKTTRQIMIDGQAMDRDQVTEELGARLSEITPEETAEYTKAASTWEKTKMGLLGIKAALTRVDPWVTAIDGLKSGVFRKYILNPIQDATGAYRVAKVAQMQKFREIVKQIEGSLTFTPITAQELGHVFRDKTELLGALLHVGNDSNLTKLLVGRNWGTQDAEGVLDRSRWDAFIARMHEMKILTKADWDFIQATWDLLEEQKPAAQRAHKRLYGHYFSEITANEIETPFGTYRGGYAPAVVDQFMAEDAAIRGDKELLERNGNSFMFPTAGRGFSKKRVEYNAPLSLDLKLVPSHIDKVLRFTHIEPAVKEVGRIVMDKGFRKQLSQLDPTVAGDMLVPWLQRAAQQRGTAPTVGQGGKANDKFWSTVRKRSGLQIMSANVVNALQNIGGFSMAAVKVKPGHLASALMTYIKSPKVTAKDVEAKSAFMATRMSNQMAEINSDIDELLLNPTTFESAKRFTEKHGHIFASSIQNVIDVVAWSGAYDEAVARGESEKDAVRSADSVVRQTQGSMNAEDISRFEAASPLVRALSMFYSYFNMQANLLGTEYTRTVRELGLKKGAGRLLYVYAMGFMIPAVIADAIVRSMNGRGLDDDDDGEFLDDLLEMFFGSQFRTATAMFPVVGPAVNAGINRFNSKVYDDRISTSPAISLVESTVSAPYSVYQAIANDGSKKQAVRDTLTMLGMFTGLPLAPLAKPAGYLIDMNEGRANPENPAYAVRGLITGKPGK